VDKGFAFVKDSGGKDYFFHQSAVQGEGISDLQEGDSVEFEVGDGPKGASRREGAQRGCINTPRHVLAVSATPFFVAKSERGLDSGVLSRKLAHCLNLPYTSKHGRRFRAAAPADALPRM
jgi:CspA family cold shock protein